MEAERSLRAFLAFPSCTISSQLPDVSNCKECLVPKLKYADGVTEGEPRDFQRTIPLMLTMGLHIDYLTGRMVSAWFQTLYSTHSICAEKGHTGEDFSGSFSDENMVRNVQSPSELVSCTRVSRQMLMICASRVQTGCRPGPPHLRSAYSSAPNMQGSGPSLAILLRSLGALGRSVTRSSHHYVSASSASEARLL